MEKIINCLSDRKFANLLFVKVWIGETEAIALFDTGAGMTVVTQSLQDRLHIAPEKESFRAGNNTGMIKELKTAVLPGMRIGNIRTDECRVLVTDDADLAFSDESGNTFPAEMLLGWDVIFRYRWSYSAKKGTLSVGTSERTTGYLSSEIRQGPIVFPEHGGHRFCARVDTGHTGSVLSAAWRSRLSDIKYHETEISGVGSSQHELLSYVPVLQLRFQSKAVCLRDVDIFDELYGQPAEIEALLGYDFLEGRDWLLDKEFGFDI